MVGLYLILPFGMGILAVSSAKHAVGLPPEGFSEVMFPTSDGQSLAAWYFPPDNGAAVLLLHGAGGSREEVRLMLRCWRRTALAFWLLTCAGMG